MSVLANSGLLATPSFSPHSSGPSTSTGHKRYKHVKRKHSPDQTDDESLVLLSTAKRRIKSPELRRQTEEEISAYDSSSDSDVSFVPFDAFSSDEENFSEDEMNSTHEISDICRNAMSQSPSLESKHLEKIMKNDYLPDLEDSEPSEYGLFYQKKNEYVNEVEQIGRKKRKLNKEQRRVLIYPLTEKNQEIVFIDLPGSITLYQYVSVEVILGKVSICGKELTPQTSNTRVFSSETTGLIELKTLSCENIWHDRPCYFNTLKNLVKYVGTQKAKALLSNVNKSTVIVAMTKHHYQAHLQFLELYFPKVLKFKTKKFGKKSFVSPIKTCSGDAPVFGRNSFSFIDKVGKTVRFNEDYEDLADDVIDAIRDANTSDTVMPKILVYGSKNTGKSMLLRFLMNKVLSVFPFLYYLDADPGQTEFTPPGVVSLTHVKDAVLGPPFCHQRKPVSMSFTGGVSADLSPYMYLSGVANMMRLYRRISGGGALFVNTMGWVKGFGLSCLVDVMKYVKPTIVIEMVNAEDSLVFDYRKHVPDGARYFQIRSPMYKPTELNAGECRSLSILSYFGKLQRPHEKPKHLNDFKPFCICWDDIPVFNCKRKLPPYRLIESLNSSVVALCYVNNSSVLDHHNELFPLTLEDEPDNECVGFGIVRAVDEVKHLLYILTPLQLSELTKVNAIISGNVMLPDSLILQQTIGFTPLYFTQEETKDEIESPSTEIYNDVAAKYRKSIKKRYGGTKKRD